MINFLIHSAIAATLIAGAAKAADTAEKLAHAGRSWQLVANQENCIVETPVEGSTSGVASIGVYQDISSSNYFIRLGGLEGGSARSGPTKVILKLGSDPAAAQDGLFLFDPYRQEHHASVKLSDRHAARLFAGEPVVIALPRGQAVRVNTIKLFAASAGLSECRKKKLSDFGLDAAALDSVAVGPSGNVVALFNPDDYPREALARDESGTVRILVTVNTNGRVTNCEVIGSSRSMSLDRTTCEVVKNRGRFKPARDHDGQPVVAPMTATISWSLP